MTNENNQEREAYAAFEKQYFMEWIEELSPGALKRGRRHRPKVSLSELVGAIRKEAKVRGYSMRSFANLDTNVQYDEADIYAQAILTKLKEDGVLFDVEN